MLLRRLVAALCPLLLCLVAGIIFRLLDSWMDGGNFFLFVFKGLVLGCAIGLLLPIAGISTQNNGLIPWLYVAAGVLLLLLTYQYLESIRLVQLPALRALLPVNGQMVQSEGAFMGFLLLTGLLNRRR